VNTEQFRKPQTPLAPRQEKSHKDPALQEFKKTNFVEAPRVIRSPKADEPKFSKSVKSHPADSDVRQSRIKLDEVSSWRCCKL